MMHPSAIMSYLKIDLATFQRFVRTGLLPKSKTGGGFEVQDVKNLKEQLIWNGVTFK